MSRKDNNELDGNVGKHSKVQSTNNKTRKKSENRKYEINVQIDFLLKLSYFYCIIHHEKKISSGQGDRNPWKSKFPTGGIVRDPLWRLIW